MPIVQHTMTQTPQPNGSLNVTLTLIDQDAVPYPIVINAPVGFDLDAWVIRKIAEQNVQLAENEFEQILGLEI